MNLSPESVKKILLNKVNELSASSWQYTKKLLCFTGGLTLLNFYKQINSYLQITYKVIDL